VPSVLEEILNRVRDGAENLNLVITAVEQHWPMDQVISILEALDINSRRLPPPPEDALLG
jgi:hypothetical protein